ncbi:hypothetical protein AB1Y20_010414 [Prymnesium parvum]|uniref:SEP domain-containing protein n=1 Tax=Prymnesium parvum TaxID=97485 RepID=A0AB34IRA2_PRYPA
MANVRGLKDVKEENDDEKRQAYYAGGQGQNGGGSGQEILDPREFMERARNEMGAQSIDEWKAQQPHGSGSSFAGAGHTLSGERVAGASTPQQPTEHTITFWQNGFTVDDGPLRTREDPESDAFLAAVNRGQMPAELMGPDGQAEGDVHIIDRSAEPYKPPPVKLKPFSGEGRSMRDAGEGTSSSAPTDPVELVVDESAPTTTLQVRLADGSRKVVKANKSHTVLQLQQHIATFTPGIGFSLRAGFPPKKLTDFEKTLGEAGLLNEAVTQCKD